MDINETVLPTAVNLAVAAELAAHIILQSGVMGTLTTRSVKGEQMSAQALKEAALAHFVKALPKEMKD